MIINAAVLTRIACGFIMWNVISKLYQPIAMCITSYTRPVGSISAQCIWYFQTHFLLNLAGFINFADKN